MCLECTLKKITKFFLSLRVYFILREYIVCRWDLELVFFSFFSNSFGFYLVCIGQRFEIV